MRKLKYGEDTVVVRVPRSLLPTVKQLLKSAEVLGSSTAVDSSSNLLYRIDRDSSLSIMDKLRIAYGFGFDAGEEYQVCLQLELSGLSDKIPVVMQSFRLAPFNPVLALSDEFVSAISEIVPDVVYLQSSFRNLQIASSSASSDLPSNP